MQPSEESIPWVTIIVVIVVLVILAVIIVAIYRYQVNLQKSEPMLLSNPTHAYEATDVKAANQTAQLSPTGQEYTYNVWMYIDDWGKNYGKMKHVLTRASTSPFNNDPDKAGAANPTIWLYPNENNLAVRVSTMKLSEVTRELYDQNLYPEYETVRTKDEGTYTNVNPNYYFNSYKKNPKEQYRFINTTVACDISNIPLQRWVMVTVVLWNRTLDVYINGFLTRSVVLPGAPLFDPSELNRIYIGGNNPHQTFGGYFSRIKYFDKAITADRVMDLYKNGPLPANYWWNALKYNIKVTLDIDQDNDS